ncbi:MAG: hypothetical protein C0519_09880 [Hyphomicrobium sp.]|nr:hypothetical protein [Hyphomicrobium sp.]PPD08327.1 MAG: hypothetical protein CTY28_05880 [Hyphomicrobium sp.]
MFVTKSFASLVAAGALIAFSVPASAEKPADICGSKPEMVDIMLRMYEDGVEKVYGDNKMFVKRDSRDGSLWVIALPNTTAHPAVACRTKAMDTAVLCNAGEKPCASFTEQAAARFKKVDDEGR